MQSLSSTLTKLIADVSIREFSSLACVEEIFIFQEKTTSLVEINRLKQPQV